MEIQHTTTRVINNLIQSTHDGFLRGKADLKIMNWNLCQELHHKRDIFGEPCYNKSNDHEPFIGSSVFGHCLWNVPALVCWDTFLMRSEYTRINSCEWCRLTATSSPTSMELSMHTDPLDTIISQLNHRESLIGILNWLWNLLIVVVPADGRKTSPSLFKKI